MPNQFVEAGETWLSCNPGWTMHLWHDGNLPPLANQAIFDDAPNLVESRLLGRMRSNIARVEIVERFGGVYLDCDFVALKGIPKKYLKAGCFVARENETFVNNGIIGAQPHHGYLQRVIKAMPESVRRQPNKPSNVTTGPHLLTRLLDDSVAVIPTAEVYPYGWQDAVAKRQSIGKAAWAHHLWAGSRQQVSVIVPFRATDYYRTSICKYVVGRLKQEHPEWQVTLVDSGNDQFSRTQAIVKGISRSFGKTIVVHDADSWSDGLLAATAHVADTGGWAIPHTNIHRLTERATQGILKGSPLTLEPCLQPPYKGVEGGGIVVIARSALEACPPDVRFVGWGGEDEAWALALRSIIGEPLRLNNPLVHLWHPPAERVSRNYGNDHNNALLLQYRNASKRKSHMVRLVNQAKTLATRCSVD